MLPKPTYVKVRLRIREYLRQFERDSCFLGVPSDVGMGLDLIIERIMREDGVRIAPGAVDGVIKYLAEKEGMMVPHPYGGWMLPKHRETPIPSIEEHKADVLKKFGELGLIPLRENT